MEKPPQRDEAKAPSRAAPRKEGLSVPAGDMLAKPWPRQR